MNNHCVLEWRLNKIKEAKVPYIIRAGNQLGEFYPEDIVVSFEAEGLPEIITDCSYDFFKKGNQNEQAKIYAKNLAKLVKKDFLEFLHSSGTNFPPYLRDVETHLIYDPKTDLTHIFLLPSGTIDFESTD